ncbi:MAG TPA: hypothetical protein PK079_17475 [Leptospiraceae bacterium]|nr:hypothetical protein [Leptospiraceae bacterium]HMW06460.1 hypothetical protein [Leptospiraceae bacterium]HMX32438.1 hypothetical protein [Leptospiraceae bacterium]HMY33681.1 hypothetical protein [Leptospiraceae bacterium]HMZ65232.1 hypothetical protein [Leptospiraceae bacterium]
MNTVINFLEKSYIRYSLFLIVYSIVTISLWQKYNYNPTSMINFGMEFAVQNKEKMPDGAVVILGNKDDLGAGYDGQIFYFYSRTISELNMNWPLGFDESYRAPRIGYPLLVGIIGFFGKMGAVYGMYIVNISLFLLSYILLRRILDEDKKIYSIFYLLSPFSLGSYAVLVSDSVMVSLVIIAYYFYQEEESLYFVLVASLAILCKEPALFLFFPLGVKALIDKRIPKALLVLSILVIPILWHLYLKVTFPNWRATRLTDFILPLEGIITYTKSILNSVSNTTDYKELARLLSRFPLLVLLMVGLITLFTGNIKRGIEFRLGIGLVFFMVSTASYYHFWSVYENVSRMFTLSIPLFILLKNDEEDTKTGLYFLLTILILLLFLVKVVLIQKTQSYTIWGM